MIKQRFNLFKLMWGKNKQMNILFILFFMMLTNAACADTKISAVILKGHEYSLARHHPLAKSRDKIYFPESVYQVNNIVLYKLKLTSNKKNKPAFTDYKDASTKGNLTLESYDSNTGSYKFKLTIKPIAILDNKMATVNGVKILPIK